MKCYSLLNKIQNVLLIALIISSLFLVVNEAFSLIALYASDGIKILSSSISSMVNCIIALLFCYFAVFRCTDGKAAFNALWGTICLLFSYCGLNAVHTVGYPLVVSFLITAVCIYCFKNMQMYLAVLLSLVCALIVGVAIGFSAEYIENFNMLAAEFISKKSLNSFFFGFTDSFYALFNSNALETLFFTKSYGGSFYFNNSIVTGVKDLFMQGYNGELLSTYLSGRFYFMFALVGFSFYMAGELKDAQKITLIILIVSSLLSGNISMFLLFVFLESPIMFFILAVLNGASYLVATLVNLNIGYKAGGSVIEMFINLNNPVYLFACGVVFICIGYFVCRFCNEKFGMSDCFNIYIPDRLKSVVKKLGGVENIVKYRNDSIQVRNIKLVNTLGFDCEMKENLVYSKEQDFTDLKEYF